jgi:hypothetical protein
MGVQMGLQMGLQVSSRSRRSNVTIGGLLELRQRRTAANNTAPVIQAQAIAFIEQQLLDIAQEMRPRIAMVGQMRGRPASFRFCSA